MLLIEVHVIFFPGNTGVAVMLYDPRRSNISKIERESGVKFEHVSAPQPADIAKAAGVDAAETITQISDRYTLTYVLNDERDCFSRFRY